MGNNAELPAKHQSQFAAVSRDSAASLAAEGGNRLSYERLTHYFEGMTDRTGGKSQLTAAPAIFRPSVRRADQSLQRSISSRCPESNRDEQTGHSLGYIKLRTAGGADCRVPTGSSVNICSNMQ